ncbi:MAG: DNA translocase FtsK 4TM domain-containing protein [Enterobacteriaceae bacterium]|nr:DNA translocase FtsK 4TM domain-containing protein [Enterobacteriaceae bacterium]
MSQEYIEDKEPKLSPLSSRQRLFEAGLLVVVIFAIFMMVALVSFNPADPSWSQTAWQEPIHNIGGEAGAWLADTLLFIFGVLAYGVPPLIIFQCWMLYRYEREHKPVDFFSLSLRFIGMLALILSACGLFAISIDDWYYFASGGVLGSLLNSALLPYFNGVGETLVLLCVWAVGLTLFTGWSWLTIAEKIGAFVMGGLTFATNRTRKQSDFDAVHVEPDQHDDPANYAALDDVLLDASDANNEVKSAVDEEQEPAINCKNELQQEFSFTAAMSDQPLPADNDVVSNETDAPSEPAFSTPAFTFQRPAPVDIKPAVEIKEPEPVFNVDHQVQNEHFPAIELPAQHDQIHHEPAVVTPTLGNLSAAMPNDTVVGVNPPAIDSVSDAFNALSSATVAAAASTLTPAPIEPVIEPTAPGMLFTPVVSGMQPQVKQGIGPELPRPNPVRIPTRRELASYGIKLPSHREAEQRERERLARAQQHSNQQHSNAMMSAASTNSLAPATSDDDVDAMQQATLSKAFADEQRQRYGEDYQLDNTNNFDEGIANNPLSGVSARDDDEQYSDDYNRRSVEPMFTLPSQDVSITNNDEVPLGNINAVAPTAATAQNIYHQPMQQPVQQPVAAPVQQPIVPTSTVQNSTFVPSQIPPQQQSQSASPSMDGLIHPFLMRNERPLEKPTTPLPSLDLLASPPASQIPIDYDALEATARLLEQRLAEFRVKARVVDILSGPVITRFELELAPGVKAASISSLERDLARSLSVTAVRVVEVIPGKPYVGIELPNEHRQMVYMREVLSSPEFSHAESPLTVVLGKDISGQPIVADLSKMPHLLVAGTTGSGKSVGVNAMILSMLYKAKPEDVRFIMIDPKMLELSVYEGIPHLLTEVVTDMKDAANALRWCVGEMERRYKLMSALGVRNLAGYNDRVQEAENLGRPVPDPFWKPSESMDVSAPMLEKLPYIVVLVDEFADLMMAVGKKVEELIARLAQKARAAGIHLVLATQRPSVDVITGLIKANIPTRMAFTVSSKIDSRTILDQSGAESLLGMGDMLYLPPNSSMPVRVHGAFVRDQEVHAVVQDWKARGRPQYIDSITASSEDGEGGFGLESGEELDPLFDQAVAFVIEKKKPSISGIQRQFRIGYNRAARIIDQMEAQGIVSPTGHNGTREILARSQFD